MSLERLRALALARQLADEAVDEAVRECLATDIDRTRIAGLLGVNRSTLYRRYIWPKPSTAEEA